MRKFRKHFLIFILLPFVGCNHKPLPKQVLTIQEKKIVKYSFFNHTFDTVCFGKKISFFFHELETDEVYPLFDSSSFVQIKITDLKNSSQNFSKKIRANFNGLYTNNFLIFADNKFVASKLFEVLNDSMFLLGTSDAEDHDGTNYLSVFVLRKDAIVELKTIKANRADYLIGYDEKKKLIVSYDTRSIDIDREYNETYCYNLRTRKFSSKRIYSILSKDGITTELPSYEGNSSICDSLILSKYE